jgi:hypothetical protein
MESATFWKSGLLVFFLIIISLTSTTNRVMNPFFVAEVATAISDNELELSCEYHEDMCLLEACLGKECTAIGNKEGFSGILSGGMLHKAPMEIAGRDNCYDTNQKAETTNYNFHLVEESNDLNSNRNLVAVNHSPIGQWKESDSSVHMGMDLGVIKNICNIDILFENDNEIENGYSISVSNDSKNVYKVVERTPQDSSPDSWISYDFSDVVGRFVHLTIPGVTDLYDDNDPLISEIRVEALPSPQIHQNSSAESVLIDNSVKQTPNNTISHLKLSPLEFLDEGSDLLNTPKFSSESYELNHDSSTDISSTLNSNKFTGDIFLP